MGNERQALSSMTKAIAMAEIANGKVQVWTFPFIIMDGRGVDLKGASLSGFVDPGRKQHVTARLSTSARTGEATANMAGNEPLQFTRRIPY